MKSVSNAYKASMKAMLRNRSYVRITFGNVDTTAATDGEWESNGAASISEFETVDYAYQYGDTYAALELNRWALELNRWALDGKTLIVPTGEAVQDGFISSLMSDAEGNFSTPPVITREFSLKHIFPGLTLTFDTRQQEWPLEVTADFYLNGEVADTQTVSITGVQTTITTTATEVDKVTITFDRCLPYRRPRLENVLYGLNVQFVNKDIVSTQQKHDVDPLSRRLPTETMQFTILDYEHKYDPDNPAGIYAYVDKNSPIEIQFGYELPDGSVDWLKPDACPPMYMPKGYLVEMAAKAKEAVNIPILAGGRMNDPDIAEAAIRDGKIDAVVMGRAALADPEYPNKVLTGHTERIRPCIACNQGCITRLQQGKQPTCAVNPTAMREIRFAMRPAIQPKKVVVVGGGVAGMETARVAAMRGHKVSLYEKNDKLGGNLIPGGSHSFKKEVRELNAWYQDELSLLPVEVHTGETVTAKELKGMGADVIVLATGSVPIMPKVPGIDDAKVIGCMDAFAHPEKVGEKVIVIGGGLVGCEMALDYAQEGKKVTVVEALPKILSAGIPSPIPNGQMIPDLFEYHHVNVMEGHKLAAVENGKAVLECAGQKK